MKMKKPIWKKIVLSFIFGILGVCAWFAGVRFLPFPIEGNWHDPYPISYVSKDGHWFHYFYRFEDGKILRMSATRSPPVWIGTYKKKGWGKYEAEVLGSKGSPTTIYSSYRRCVTSDEWLGSRMSRNFLSDCRESVNNPSNDWVSVGGNASFRITGTPENRTFHSWRGEQTKDEIEAMLNCIFSQPLQIYTASNEVPSPVLETLDGLGVVYIIHANQEWLAPDKNQVKQEWVVPDTLKTNPIWRAIDNRALYGLIITPPFWQPRFGDHRDKDFTYLTNDGFSGLEHLGGVINNHRRRGDDWQKNLRLYVENGVLPEDVKQLFEPFDLEYTVLDEKILYRGKRKDPYAKKGGTP